MLDPMMPMMPPEEEGAHPEEPAPMVVTLETTPEYFGPMPVIEDDYCDFSGEDTDFTTDGEISDLEEDPGPFAGPLPPDADPEYPREAFPFIDRDDREHINSYQSQPKMVVSPQCMLVLHIAELNPSHHFGSPLGNPHILALERPQSIDPLSPSVPQTLCLCAGQLLEAWHDSRGSCSGPEGPFHRGYHYSMHSAL